MTLQDIRDTLHKLNPRSAPERRLKAIVSDCVDRIDAARTFIVQVAESDGTNSPSAREWLKANTEGRSAHPVIRATEEDIAWAKQITGEHHAREKHTGEWMSCDSPLCVKGRKMVEIGTQKKAKLEEMELETK